MTRPAPGSTAKRCAPPKRTAEDGSYNAILDSTALALSHVCDIYAVNTRGKLFRIPDSELTIGAFEGGAKCFRANDGTVYEALSIRRGDMTDAIEILRKAESKPR